jgi:hypothetical protein
MVNIAKLMTVASITAADTIRNNLLRIILINNVSFKLINIYSVDAVMPNLEPWINQN